MKKIFNVGVMALAITAVLSGCSKNSGMSEAEVQQYQQEKKVAELRKAYSTAFAKAFGTISPNNAWGFDRTTGSVTRTASVRETLFWDIPENLWGGSTNKEGWNANEAEDDFKNNKFVAVLSSFNFNNYFIQHVEKPKNDKNNKKKTIEILQAWNSKLSKWEDVTNFEQGDNPDGEFKIVAEDTYFYTNIHKSAKGTTLMKDMGGAPCNETGDGKGKMFRLKLADNAGYSYNYTIKMVANSHKDLKKDVVEPMLGFRIPNGSYWVMRLAEARLLTDDVVAEGRILCEDMGANDFDFNDVVFDAQILNSGAIKIKVLAHGGKLPISIAGVKVTLGEMTNTGLADDDVQEFTIPAGRYSNIIDIPVEVVPNGDANNAYDLTAQKGAAPQKVCVPVGTLWPDEYVRIDRAYSPFTSYVNISNPAEWTYTVNSPLVDLDLTNN